MSFEMEKRPKDEEMERLREKADKSLLEIRDSFIKKMEDVSQRAEKAIQLAETDEELDEIRKHYDQEMQRLLKEQLEQNQKVQQEFFKKIKAL